jgi:hypothetical protein
MSQSIVWLKRRKDRQPHRDRQAILPAIGKQSTAALPSAGMIGKAPYAMLASPS